MGLKLNLGCGESHIKGFVNVDMHGSPDVKCNLESFPWPWENDSVEAILMIHVLEHLGQKPANFIKIMQELYRICEADAKIKIAVPHHQHEYYHSDPTHVRPITALGMLLFCQRINRKWIAEGSSNSPLGIYNDVDFEIESTTLKPSDLFRQRNPGQHNNVQLLLEESRLYNNMIEQLDMTLRVIKPAGSYEVAATGS